MFGLFIPYMLVPDDNPGDADRTPEYDEGGPVTGLRKDEPSCRKQRQPDDSKYLAGMPFSPDDHVDLKIGFQECRESAQQVPSLGRFGNLVRNIIVVKKPQQVAYVTGAGIPRLLALTPAIPSQFVEIVVVDLASHKGDERGEERFTSFLVCRHSASVSYTHLRAHET